MGRASACREFGHEGFARCARAGVINNAPSRHAILVLHSDIFCCCHRAARREPGGNARLDAANKAFQDNGWARAEREFGEFPQQFPKSDRRAQAALRQAQARCKLGDYRGLSPDRSRATEAGALADQFAYWLGEAQFQSTNYTDAVAAFHAVMRIFRNPSCV